MSSASQPPRSAKPRAAAPPVASTRIGATGGGVAAPAHRGDASAVEQVQVLQAAMQSLRQDVATLKRQAVASDAHHRSEIEGLKRARLDDKEDGPVTRYQCGFCDRYMTDCQKSCAGWRLLEVSDEEDGPVYHCGYCDRFLSDCQKSCAGWRAAAEAAAAAEAEAEAAAAGSDEDEVDPDELCGVCGNPERVHDLCRFPCSCALEVSHGLAALPWKLVTA